MNRAIVFALALLAASTLADRAAACDFVAPGVNRVTMDDSPACLVFADTRSDGGSEQNLDVRNDCRYPVTIACVPGSECADWTRPGLDAPVVIEAGAADSLTVQEWTPTTLSWAGEDGLAGTVSVAFEADDIGDPCAGFGDDQFCAASPGGATGSGGAGWLLLGLLGLRALRRRL